MTITSCNPYPIKLRESSRTYSPDSTKYLLRYDKVSWDGYPFPYVTILNSSDNVYNPHQNYFQMGSHEEQLTLLCYKPELSPLVIGEESPDSAGQPTGEQPAAFAKK